MNQLQTALLEHDLSCSKKDYLFRWPVAPEAPIIDAFEPFQPDLTPLAQNGKWPPYLTKKQINQNLELFMKGFNDNTATPAQHCFSHRNNKDAHNSIKVTSSYYWPKIYQDIKQHVQTYLTCQRRKRAPMVLYHCPYQNAPTGEFMQIYLDPC